MKVSDPIDKLKDKLSLFVFQEDLTFGKNIYEFTYLRENNGVALVVFNSDALYYSIFKAIEKRDLNSVFIAYDAGDYVLLYVSMKAKFKKIIGLENKLKNSFMARLDAMSKWFIDKYNE